MSVESLLDTEPMTILIADDHPLFRDALRQVVVEGFPDHHVVEAYSRASAVEALDSHDPDIVLLDLNMPGMNGFAGLISLRDHAPSIPIVVISADEDMAVIRQSLVFGASGFIPKSMPKDQLTAGIRAVLAGEVFVPVDFTGYRARPTPENAEFAARFAALTSQQRKVLEALVAGQSNKVIAHEMDITEGTVKAHVSAVLRKLGVSSRTQAVLNASKMMGREDREAS